MFIFLSTIGIVRSIVMIAGIALSVAAIFAFIAYFFSNGNGPGVE